VLTGKCRAVFTAINQRLEFIDVWQPPWIAKIIHCGQRFAPRHLSSNKVSGALPTQTGKTVSNYGAGNFEPGLRPTVPSAEFAILAGALAGNYFSFLIVTEYLPAGRECALAFPSHRPKEIILEFAAIKHTAAVQVYVPTVGRVDSS
jgi:hypothetical protein